MIEGRVDLGHYLHTAVAVVVAVVELTCVAKVP